jgi:hypothetical protein
MWLNVEDDVKKVAFIINFDASDMDNLALKIHYHLDVPHSDEHFVKL